MKTSASIVTFIQADVAKGRGTEADNLVDGDRRANIVGKKGATITPSL